MALKETSNSCLMQNITKKLFDISKKKSRTIIGLMSGTSLDGLDLALCNVSGAGFHTQLKIEIFETIAYHPPYAQQLKEIFAKENIPLAKLTRLHRDTGRLYGKLINEFIEKHQRNKKDIDLISSHGQTIFHIPSKINSQAATLQIGDADEIARITGILTVSDFRQKHIAAGGEGAPLAPYGDLLLFHQPAASKVLVNIGGIANLSFIRKGAKQIIYSDTGPGNTLIDQFVQKEFGLPFDRNGEKGREGKVSEKLLQAFLDEPFFHQPYPKSTGQELFNLTWLEKRINETNVRLAPEDVVHTLTALTARTIAQSIKAIQKEPGMPQVYVSGGGIHNKLLMDLLAFECWGLKINTTGDLGLPPDAKEAVLFALLANECVAGDPDVFKDTGLLPVRMGKISFPN